MASGVGYQVVFNNDALLTLFINEYNEAATK